MLGRPPPLYGVLCAGMEKPALGGGVLYPDHESSWLLLGMTGSWLRGFDGLPVFDPAFVAKVAAILRLALTFRRFAVFVHFFLNEASAFLDLTLHAHVVLHRFRFAQRLLSTTHKGPLLI